MNEPKRKHTYGPVPSRRLGFSLGIDIIPHKVCTYDCIYCQLGRTTQKTTAREDYAPPEQILEEIKLVLRQGGQIDHLTFSGSGEPTLNKSIGRLITGVKKMSGIPVAVLTNGSTLSFADVRDDLSEADVVVPTLCSNDGSIFTAIHRPHPQISIKDVINGYCEFRRTYSGKIWLEVMLIKGMNDRPEHIAALKSVIDRIMPDRIHLNTVVRPPSEPSARPVSEETLQAIRTALGDKAEIITDFRSGPRQTSSDDRQEMILSIIERRPVTMSDLATASGLHENEIVKIIEDLLRQRKVVISKQGNKDYYELARRPDDRTEGSG